jgi:hypothetical protein
MRRMQLNPNLAEVARILAFLRQPCATEPIKGNRLLCRCGDLRCHQIQYCHRCGGAFNIDPRSICYGENVAMQRNKPRRRFRDSMLMLYGLWQQGDFPNANFNEFEAAFAQFERERSASFSTSHE